MPAATAPRRGSSAASSTSNQMRTVLTWTRLARGPCPHVTYVQWLRIFDVAIVGRSSQPTVGASRVRVWQSICREQAASPGRFGRRTARPHLRRLNFARRFRHDLAVGSAPVQAASSTHPWRPRVRRTINSSNHLFYFVASTRKSGRRPPRDPPLLRLMSANIS